MNIDPQLLQDAIVHQAVHAAALTNSQQALSQVQQKLTETQQALDAIARDRAELKASSEKRIAELTDLNDAQDTALADAAKLFNFETVDAMLAAIKPTTDAAPQPSGSEGGEAD